MQIPVDIMTGGLSVSDIVTVRGQLLHRRAVSKRLVFYDLCPVASSSNNSQQPLELVVKEDVFGGADAIRELRSSLKLGDEVEAQGHMESSSSMHVTALRVLQRWRDAHPSLAFQPQMHVAHIARSGSAAVEAQQAATVLPSGAYQRAAAPQPAGAADDVHSTSSSTLMSNAPTTSASSILEPTVQLCKFFVSTGRCAKGGSCPYLHTQPRDNPAAWRSWTRRRQEAKHATAAALGFTHSSGEPSKYHRAQLFCTWLVNTFGRDFLNAGAGVVDVAGGQGGVTFELQVVHGIKCTLVEPRAMKLGKLQHRALASRRVTASICQLATTTSHANKQEDVSAAPISTKQASEELSAEQQAAGHPASDTPEASAVNGTDADAGCSQHCAAEAGSTAPAGQPGVAVASATPDADADADVRASETALSTAAETCGTSQALPECNALQLMQLQAHFDKHLWASEVWTHHGLDKCSLILGLHPDQATEPILEYAVAANKAFALVPCCVFPRLFPERRIHVADSLSGQASIQPVVQYAELVEYLVQKGSAQKAALGFEGADWVVYRGNSSSMPPAHTADTTPQSTPVTSNR